jgi:5-methylcytosine-specific restriction protein A
MPFSAKRACRAPGCPNLVELGTTYCPEHKQQQRRQHDEKRGTTAERGYGHTWQKLRLMILRNEPLCRDPFGTHADLKQTVVATEVDHIVPLSAGGSNTKGNLMPLCGECHRRKTAIDGTRRLRPSKVATTIIAGPPAAGKSTFVSEHKGANDLVVDVDWLFRALSGGLEWYDKPDVLLPFVFEARDAVLARLGRASDVRKAWVITSEPDIEAVKELRGLLDCEAIMMETSLSDCIKHIHSDPRRQARAGLWENLIRDWFDKYNGPPF